TQRPRRGDSTTGRGLPNPLTHPGVEHDHCNGFHSRTGTMTSSAAPVVWRPRRPLSRVRLLLSGRRGGHTTAERTTTEPDAARRPTPRMTIGAPQRATAEDTVLCTSAT